MSRVRRTVRPRAAGRNRRLRYSHQALQWLDARSEQAVLAGLPVGTGGMQLQVKRDFSGTGSIADAYFTRPCRNFPGAREGDQFNRRFLRRARWRRRSAGRVRTSPRCAQRRRCARNRVRFSAHRALLRPCRPSTSTGRPRARDQAGNTGSTITTGATRI